MATKVSIATNKRATYHEGIFARGSFYSVLLTGTPALFPGDDFRILAGTPSNWPEWTAMVRISGLFLVRSLEFSVPT